MLEYFKNFGDKITDRQFKFFMWFIEIIIKLIMLYNKCFN